MFDFYLTLENPKTERNVCGSLADNLVRSLGYEGAMDACRLHHWDEIRNLVEARRARCGS